MKKRTKGRGEKWADDPIEMKDGTRENLVKSSQGGDNDSGGPE